MAQVETAEFRRTIEEVSSQLIGVDHRDGFSFVKVPIVYPSGSGVVIQVRAVGSTFFVTDFGAGYDEAEMMGAATLFARHAKRVAETSGVGFDSHSFFVMEVTEPQLPSAIVTIANCSREAVTITAHRLNQQHREDDAEELYDRLRRIFPQRAVAKKAEIRGDSTTQWEVDALVKWQDRSAVFEAVVNHHSSISAANMKFGDLAKVQSPPIIVGVVRRKAEFKTYLSILSRNATILEKSTSDSTFEKAAA
jgi:hypothetical protein